MELTKSLFETGVLIVKEGAWQGDFSLASEAKLPLTTSLSEAVQARVRRLGGNAQAALDLAAVIGHEFDFEVLNEAWGRGEESTLDALDELLRHRLVEEQIGLDVRDYRFTHQKIQEVVYQSLPRQRRYFLHARAGAALEKFYVAEVETKAGELAYHFELACLQDKSLSSKAIGYLQQAGAQAVRGSDNQQAANYYQRSLDILLTLPESEARMEQEVELLMVLAAPASILKGYASPEIKRIYDRAYDLCQRLGEIPELFTSLVGLVRYYGVTGDLETGGKLAEQLLTIARATQENDFLLEACRQKGAMLFVLGRFSEARKFWEQGLVHYDQSRHEYYAARFGHDPEATCLSFLSITLWLLGYPEQALMQTQKLYNLIQSFTHPSSRAYACSLLAVNAYLRHDAKLALEHAETAIQLSLLHGLISWKYLATVLKGWALFEEGQITDGLALMEAGTQAWQARGFAHFTPFLLTLQAEACLKAQKLDQGLSAVAAALEMAQRIGDHYWEAEIHRLYGELLRASGAEDGIVAAHYQRALEIARQQGARMLELRAAMSLVRLQPENNQSFAWQELVEVYGWFSEGFDTCDLQEATDTCTNN
jgi:predicted ATPase